MANPPLTMATNVTESVVVALARKPVSQLIDINTTMNAARQIRKMPMIMMASPVSRESRHFVRRPSLPSFRQDRSEGILPPNETAV
jgi:hypothetical protein